jgi:hypothetical protein
MAKARKAPRCKRCRVVFYPDTANRTTCARCEPPNTKRNAHVTTTTEGKADAATE